MPRDRTLKDERFSPPVQTSPADHPVFCTMSTWSFRRVKRVARGVDHPPPTMAEVKERVGLYIHTHSGFPWPLLRNFTFTFTLTKPTFTKASTLFLSTIWLLFGQGPPCLGLEASSYQTHHEFKHPKREAHHSIISRLKFVNLYPSDSERRAQTQVNLSYFI